MNKAKLILQPIVSEKSFALASNFGKYSFRVPTSANKIEIAKVVESTFDVTVVNVKTLNVRARKVRFGRMRKQGSRSAWKKAIVTLKKGDKIELFEAE